jgi:hypothetical protein
MTFEEWYKSTYPGDYNLAVLAKSPIAIKYYEQAKAAWEASRENLRSWDI